jgi:hypothetical protein
LPLQVQLQVRMQNWMLMRQYSVSEHLGALTMEEAKMQQCNNGVPATCLQGVIWRKSRSSNPSGNCVELAELPNGGVAVRNSRHPAGPALIYTDAEIAAFIRGAKDGEFDDLVGDRSPTAENR